MVMNVIHSMNARVCQSWNASRMISHPLCAWRRTHRAPCGWRSINSSSVGPNPIGVYR